ncbi:MAG: ATP synthase F1 subunit delta [Candidatus Buchananbacteria bacterium]|nr:ATP synthase F1 subunit delta [Candidatus Buchananbacteria bacterium]
MKIKPQQYAQVLFESLEQAPQSDWQKMINNFAKLLLEHNQISQLDKIIYFFDKLWNKRKNITSTKIISAYKLDEQTETLLKKYLEKLVDGEIEFSAEVDKKLKGGFLLRYNDNLIDYSLKNRLRKLKTKLIN